MCTNSHWVRVHSSPASLSLFSLFFLALSCWIFSAYYPVCDIPFVCLVLCAMFIIVLEIGRVRVALDLVGAELSHPHVTMSPTVQVQWFSGSNFIFHFSVGRLWVALKGILHQFWKIKIIFLKDLRIQRLEVPFIRLSYTYCRCYLNS